MRIAVGYIGGYPKLSCVMLPIAVNAKSMGDGHYSVLGEEFRESGFDEKMPEANNGKGLGYSVYGDRIRP